VPGLGSAGLAAALVLTSVIVFVIGSVIAGLGAGLTFNGTLRVISGATSAKARSEVFSAACVISYTALSVPSLAAGLLARWRGLEATAYLYIAFVAVLSVITRGSRRTPTGSPAHRRRAIRDLRGLEPAPRAPRADPVLSPRNHPCRRTFLKGFEHASDHRARP
jgi:MFS family permease